MWYVGVGIAIVASFCGALGDNVIRLSFLRENSKSSFNRRTLFKRPLWIIGIFLNSILNSILTIVALNFASAAIITPFAGLHIFWNVILANYFLNEEVTYQHYLGSFFILIGFVFVLTFGFHGNLNYNLEELINLYMQNSFLIYSFFCLFLITFCIFIFLSSVYKDFHDSSIAESREAKSKVSYKIDLRNNENDLVEASNEKKPTSSKRTTEEGEAAAKDRLNLSAALFQNTKSLCTQKYTNTNSEKKDDRSKNPSSFQSFFSPCHSFCPSSQLGDFPVEFLRFTTSAASGIAGGNTNIIAQNVIKVLNSEGFVVFQKTQFFFIFLSLIVLAFIQIAFLNIALAKYKTLFVVPISMSLLITSSCLGDLCMYNGISNVSSSNILLFTGGALCIICGIVMLSAADATRNEKKESEKQLKNKNKNLLFRSLFHEKHLPTKKLCNLPSPHVIGNTKEYVTEKFENNETEEKIFSIKERSLLQKLIKLFKKIIENKRKKKYLQLNYKGVDISKECTPKVHDDDDDNSLNEGNNLQFSEVINEKKNLNGSLRCIAENKEEKFQEKLNSVNSEDEIDEDGLRVIIIEDENIKNERVKIVDNFVKIYIPKST